MVVMVATAIYSVLPWCCGKKPHFLFADPWKGVGKGMLSPGYLLWYWWHACQSVVWAQRPSHAMYQLFLWQISRRCVCWPTLLIIFWFRAITKAGFCQLVNLAYPNLAILSSQLRQRISRHHFTSSSALRQQSTLRTAAHASEVWRMFTFMCQTNSLEQSAIITAWTHWHSDFQTSTKKLSFSTSIPTDVTHNVSCV